MTNYNDGKWHGWNGGECPVHPKSVVEGYWRYDNDDSAGGAVYNRGHAYGLNFAWDGGTKLQLFRVIKEYREPREFWLHKHHYAGWTVCSAKTTGAILFREVIE